MDTIIEMAKELGAAIQQDARFLAYKAAKEKSDADLELQTLIGEFGLKRAAVNHEMESGAKDEEKFRRLNTELRACYEKIMQNENMQAYNDAKNALDTLLDSINSILATSVNGEEASGCSGSCSSCSGCC